MEEEERCVKVYGISDKKLQEVINYVLLDNSMLYYVDVGQFKVTYDVLKSELNLRYLYTPEQRKMIDGKLTNRIKFEYSDAKVHPFRKFRAPFSGKAEHTFSG